MSPFRDAAQKWGDLEKPPKSASFCYENADIKMTARLWLPALVAVVAVVVGAYGRA